MLALAGCGQSSSLAPALHAALSDAQLAVGAHLSAGGAQLELDQAAGQFVFRVQQAASSGSALVSVGAAPHESRLGASEPAVSVSLGQARIALRPLAGPLSLGAGVERGASLIYPARGGDAAVALTPHGSGIKEDIVLTRALGDQLSFAWELTLSPGLAARLLGDGSIRVEGHGTTPFTLPAPVVRDANGATLRDRASFELSGSRVVLRAHGLAGLRYPISVDPSIVVSTNAGFAYPSNDEGLVQLGNSQVARTPVTGGLGAFTTLGSTLPGGAAYAGCSTTWNGTFYYVSTQSGADNIYWAPLNLNGTVGAFTRIGGGTGVGTPRAMPGCAAFNGYLYVVGGYNAAAFADVYVSKINSDGSLGGFTPTNSIPAGLGSGRGTTTLVAANGFLYAVGGFEGNNSAPYTVSANDVIYAPLTADGKVGAWTAGTPFATPRTGAGAVAVNNRLYVFGGDSNNNGVTLADAQSAPIDPATGAVGAWTATSALPTPTEQLISGQANGYVYAIGGENGNVQSNTVMMAQVNANGLLGAWTQAGTFSGVRTEFFGAVAQGNIYVAGGAFVSGTLQFRADIQSAPVGYNFAPASVAAAAGSTLPDARDALCSVTSGGYVWIMGGENSGSLATVYSAPLTADGSSLSFTGQRALPSARNHFACAAYNGYIYIAGGASGGAAIRDLYYSQIGANGTLGVWTAASNLYANARDGLGMVVHNGRLYVYGGRSGTSFFNDTQYATIAANGDVSAFTTSAATAFANPRAYHAAFANGERLYVAGGQGPSSAFLKDVEVATINSDGSLGNWTVTQAFANKRDEFTAAVVNGGLYVFGGYDGTAARGDIEVSNFNADGTLGTFLVAGALPAPRYSMGSVLWNGRVIFLGGANTSSVNTVYASVQNLGGTLASQSIAINSTPGDRYAAPIAASSGYLYQVGGWPVGGGPASTTTVRYASIGGSGAAGSWSSPSTGHDLNTARGYEPLVVNNGYLYAIGGEGGQSGAYTSLSSIEYAKLNADGTPANWSLANHTFTTGRQNGGAAFWAGRLYILGGTTQSLGGLNDVQYGSVDAATGNFLTAWSTATHTMQVSRGYCSAVAHNGYLYAIGNNTDGTVEYAPILGSGDVGTFKYTTNLPVANLALVQSQTYAIGGYLYLATTDEVYAAPFNADGSLGPWLQTLGYPTPSSTGGQSYTAYYNNYLYRTLEGGTATGELDVALVNSPLVSATYSRLFDLSLQAASIDALTAVTSGAGTVSLQARASDANGVFAALQARGAVTSGAAVTIGASNARYLWTQLTLDDSLTAVPGYAGNVGAVTSLTLSYTGASATLINPTAIAFGAARTPALTTVYVTNNGNAAITLQAPVVTPSGSTTPATGAGEFTAAGETGEVFPLVIQPGSTATVDVTFTPAAVAARAATLTLTTDNGSTNIPLTGTGTNVTVVSPSPLAFGPVGLGSSATLPLSIFNDGGSTITLGSIAVSPSTDFSAPTSAVIIPAGTSAQLSVTFAPTALGSRAATLSFSDADGSHSVSLSGTGVAATLVSPGALAFGSQRVGAPAVLALSIFNHGSTTLTLSSISIAPATDFSAPTSNLTIPAASSAQLNVTFTPTATGSRGATLSFIDADGSHSVPLTGNGTQPNAALGCPAFVSTLVGGTSTISATVTNPAGATVDTLNVFNYAISGSDAADFAITGLPAGNKVAPGAAGFAYQVTFRPSRATVASSETATLTLSSDNTTALTCSLSGVGLGAVPSVSPTAPRTGAAGGFGDVVVGNPATISITISNSGSQDLSITAATLTAVTGGNFAVAGPQLAGNPPPGYIPATVPAQGSATFNAGFAPTALGGAAASLDMTSSAGHIIVTLTGNGVGPQVAVVPSPVAFGNQRQNVTSAVQSVTIANTGTGPMLIDSVSVTGDAAEFAIVTQPTSPVAAGGSTTMKMTYKPVNTAASSGTLTVVTDNSTSTAPVTTFVPLTGTGTLPVPLLTCPPSGSYVALQGTSIALNVNLKNTSTNDTLNVLGFTMSGANASDFSLVQGGAAAIGPGATSSFLLSFLPTTASGTETATLTMHTDGGDQACTVTGQGQRAVASLPAGLEFNTVQKNTTATLKATLTNSTTNTGALPVLIVTSANIIGTANGFATPAISTITLNPNASQDFTVTFTPPVVGHLGSTLELNTNIGIFDVVLSGTGTFPSSSLSPTALAFGSQRTGTTSTAQTLVVANSGSAADTIGAPVLSDTTNYTIQAPTAGASLAAGSSHTWQVVFNPTTPVAHPATITFSTTEGAVLTANLTGTGTTPVPGIVCPGAFPVTTTGQTATAQNVTVNNTGNGSYQVTGFSLSGADKADFIVAPTSGQTVPVSAPFPTWAITFKPSHFGAETAQVTFATDLGPTVSCTLNGTGQGVSQTLAAVAQFPDTRKGLTSPTTRSLVLTNTGNVALNLSNVVITPPGAFTAVLAGPNPLQPNFPTGSTTAYTISFTPQALGFTSATISITTEAGTVSTGLSGIGLFPATAVAPASIDFGTVRRGNISPNATVSVTNGGSDFLVVNSVSVDLPNEFKLDRATGATLQPGTAAAWFVAFQPSATGTRPGVLTVNTDNGNFTVALTGVGSAATPAISCPAAFAAVVGQTATDKIVIGNSGQAVLTVSSFQLTGPNASDFTISPSGASINASASQNFVVNYRPGVTGAESATVVFTADAGNPGDLTCTLSGTGQSPTGDLSTNLVVFAPTRVGSAAPVQKVTLTNNGTSPMHITGATLASTTFTAALEATSSTTVAPNGGTAVYDVGFVPAASGNASATLTLTTDTGTKAVALSGTGTFPVMSVFPLSLTFGNQTVNTVSGAAVVSVVNTGTDTMTVSAPVLSDSSDFAVTPAGGATIPAGGEASWSLNFQPRTATALSGTLTLTSEAGSKLVSFSGTGIAPALQVTCPAAFTAAVGATASRNLTVKNTGTDALNLSGLALSGTNSSDFAVGNLTATNLAAGTTVTVPVTFRGSAPGTEVAQLDLTSSAGPATCPLNATVQGGVTTQSVTSLDFATQRVGTTAGAKLVTVTNTGNVVLNVSNVAVARTVGTGPTGFAVALQSGLAALSPGASTTWAVTFAPPATGPVSAALVFTTDGQGPTPVALTGTGVFPATAVAPSALAFGALRVGQKSAAQLVTLTNTGTADLAVQAPSIAAGPHYAVTPAAGATISAGTSATWSVTYSPAATGSESATLSWATDNGTTSVGLSGSGVAPVAGITCPAGLGTFDARVGAGPSAAQTITVSNTTGTDTLNVGGFSFNPSTTGSFDFQVAPTSAATAIAAGGSHGWAVTFTPSRSGAQSGTILFATDGGTFSCPLAGIGRAGAVSLSATALDFGDVRQGTSAAKQTVTLTNNGNTPVVLSGASVSGAQATAYTVTPSVSSFGPGYSATLAAAGSVSFDVVLTPSSSGAQTATLTVGSDSGPEIVALTGRGIYGATSLSPTALSFASQRPGTVSAAQPIVLANSGTDTLNLGAATLSDPLNFSVAPPAVASLAPGAIATWVVAFTPHSTGLFTATLAIVTDNGLQDVTLTGTGALPGAVVSGAVAFGAQAVGTRSPPTAVLLTNNGGAALNVSGFTVSGANPGDFLVSPGSAGLSIPAGGIGTWTVQFAPSLPADESATLTFQTELGDFAVPLGGTGLAGVASVSTSAIAFGNVRDGNTARANVVLSNAGNAPVAVTSFSVAPASAAAAFGAALKVGSTSIFPLQGGTFEVTFAPATPGAVSGTLTFVTSAGNLTVALSGTGIFPAATPSATSVSFGNQRTATASKAQTFLIANTGTDTLNLSAPSLSNGAEFAIAPTTTTTLAAGATATWSITFTPSAVGARSGTLSFTGDTGPITVQLGGTGVKPGASTNVSKLAFGDQRVGTASPGAPVQVLSTGTDTLSVSGFTLTGASAADFAVSPTSQRTDVLPAGSAPWTVTFTPTTAAAETASLTFLTDAGNQVIALTGTGRLPTADVSASALAFGNQRKGIAATAKGVVVTNNGNTPLNVASAAIAGSGSFTVSPTGTVQIAAGTSATWTVGFLPGATGLLSGTLSLSTDVGSRTVALSGTGIFPAVVASPATLPFGNQRKAVTSVPLPIVLSNTGTDTLTLTGFTSPPNSDFAVTTASGTSSIAAGGAVTFLVTFTPSGNAAESSTLVFHGDVGDVPIALTGTSVSPAAGLAPTSLDFGRVHVATHSAALSVALSNTGSDKLNVSGFDLIGADAADFFVGTPIASGVAAGGTANYAVSFTPSHGGAEAATLVLHTDSGDQSVALAGTGTSAQAAASPAALAFGTQRQGTASSPLSLTISNTGNDTLAISGFGLSGTDMLDFTVSPASAAISIAAGKSAAWTVVFAPRKAAPESASLSFSSSAGDLVVPLTGTGIGGSLTFAPASLDFGDQRVGVLGGSVGVQVVNSSTAPITISALSLGGANGSDFTASAPVLPATLTQGASLSVSVAFTAGAVGARGATLLLTTDATAGATASLPLTGTGSSPTVSMSPSSLDFGTIASHIASTPVTVTLTNTGNDSLQVKQISIPTSTSSAAFKLGGLPALPKTLQAGDKLTFTVQYAPATPSTDTASVAIVSDDPHGTTASLPLQGANASPQIAVVPTSVSFGGVRVGTVSAAQAITVVNAGAAAGTVQVPVLAGANAADFALSGAPAAAQTLPPGGSLSFLATCAPAAHGARAAEIDLATDSGPQVVALSCSGLSATLSASPLALDFGTLPEGTTKSLTLTLQNPGDIALHLGLPSVVGAGAAQFLIGSTTSLSTLLPGAPATITVAYSPTAAGTSTATLHFEPSDAATSAVDIALTGSSADPALTVPATLDFGSIDTGKTSVSQNLDIKNSGTVDVTVLALLPSSTAFAVSGGPAMPATLHAGDTLSVRVTFAPSTTGSLTGSVSVLVQGKTSPVATVQLTGSGTAPAKTGCTSAGSGLLAPLGLLVLGLAMRRRRGAAA